MMNLQENNKKVIIFDFDETLVTLDLDWRSYMSRVIEEMSRIDSGITNKYSPDNLDHNLTNEMIMKYGDRARDIDLKISEEFEMNELNSYSVHQQMFSEIEKLENITLYIWSTNTKNRIQTILQEVDKIDLFKEIISKNDVQLTKPYPDGFYLIDQKEKLERKDYLFVGNSKETDELAASSSGIEFMLV